MVFYTCLLLSTLFRLLFTYLSSIVLQYPKATKLCSSFGCTFVGSFLFFSASVFLWPLLDQLFLVALNLDYLDWGVNELLAFVSNNVSFLLTGLNFGFVSSILVCCLSIVISRYLGSLARFECRLSAWVKFKFVLVSLSLWEAILFLLGCLGGWVVMKKFADTNEISYENAYWGLMFFVNSGLYDFSAFSDQNISTILLVGVFLPFFSSVFLLLGGSFLGFFGSAILSLFSLAASTTIVLLIFFRYIYASQSVVVITFSSKALYGSFFNWCGLPYCFSLYFDFLSVCMCVLVLCVSFCVNLYSFNYLLKDPHLIRFFSYLSLFTFFMLFLVCSDNLLQFFFAWEGVGICSYLLIGFWTTRLQAVKSAMKAVLINKIGDLSLLYAIAMSWSFLGVYKFSQYAYFTNFIVQGLFDPTINYSSDLSIMKVINIVSLCFLIAAVGKSAQIGLHTWLPDAMEGPTPVSALIHAATMVTAGVFLLYRINVLLSLSALALLIITIIGGLTATMAGLIAIYQVDIKKIIAYSTCSQLGYMFFSCGMSLFSASLFHLISHGFFKALLFLVAGSLIHLYQDEQDSRKLLVFEKSKLTSLYSFCLYIGLVSLGALPFFSGFYSKENIIAANNLIFFEHIWFSASLSYNFGILASVCTLYYSSVLLKYVLQQNAKRVRSNVIHSFVPFTSKASLGFLSILSIFFGFYYKTFLLSSFVLFFESANLIGSASLLKTFTVTQSVQEAPVTLPLFWDLLPMLLGLFLAFLPFSTTYSYMPIRNQLYASFTFLKEFKHRSKTPEIVWSQLGTFILGKFRWLFREKFHFDWVANTITLTFLNFCYTRLLKSLDKGLLEHLGPYFISSRITTLSWLIRSLQKNILFEGFIFIVFFVFVNILVF